MKTFAFLLFLLLIGSATAGIFFHTGASADQDNQVPLVIDAYEYKGDVSVQIQDGESAGMEYYITFFPWGEDCGFQKCYYGFVNNYTMENNLTF